MGLKGDGFWGFARFAGLEKNETRNEKKKQPDKLESSESPKRTNWCRKNQVVPNKPSGAQWAKWCTKTKCCTKTQVVQKEPSGAKRTKWCKLILKVCLFFQPCKLFILSVSQKPQELFLVSSKTFQQTSQSSQNPVVIAKTNPSLTRNFHKNPTIDRYICPRTMN